MGTLLEFLQENFEVGKVSSTGYFNTRCPSGTHPDRSASFGVDLSTGQGRCYACDYHPNLAHLLMDLKDLTYPQALLLARSLDLDEEAPKASLYLPNLAPLPARYHPYFGERGISHRSVRLYQLTYDAEKQAIAIPVHSPDGRRLVGYIYRTLEDDATLRYFHSDDFPKKHVLWGYHQAALSPPERLFLVEGVIDAITLIQQGYPAVAHIGGTLSPAQQRLLKRLGSDIIALVDTDHIGLRHADRYAAYGYTIAVLSTPDKDANAQYLNSGTVQFDEIRPYQWLAYKLRYSRQA